MKHWVTVLSVDLSALAERMQKAFEDTGYKGEIRTLPHGELVLGGSKTGLFFFEWAGDKDPELDHLCAAVDGRIEVYSYRKGLVGPFVYGNEEALFLRLPPNPLIPPCRYEAREYPLFGDLVLLRSDGFGNSLAMTGDEIADALSKFHYLPAISIGPFSGEGKQGKLKEVLDGNKDAENGGVRSTPDA